MQPAASLHLCTGAVAPFTNKQTKKRHKMCKLLKIYFGDAAGWMSNYSATLVVWHAGPRGEEPQSKCRAGDCLTHVWGGAPVPVKASKHERRIWTTTNHYINSDLDTGRLVTCVSLFGVWLTKIIIICFTNQGKGTRHLLTATPHAQLNTQRTISVINTSLLSPSGSTHNFPAWADSTLASLQEVLHPHPDSNELQMKM